MSGAGGEIPTATWARLRDGAWGLRVQGEARPGDTVRAVRASGASALVRVGRIVWSGEGVTLATAGEEVREPRAEAAPRRRGGTRRAAPVEAPVVEAPRVEAAPALVQAPAPVEATLALAVGRLGTEARTARAEGRADAGDLAAAAHRALDAWIAEAAPVEAPAPVQAPAPVAEAPRAAGCKPWRRCMRGGCAACAPDAPPAEGSVPF